MKTLLLIIMGTVLLMLAACKQPTDPPNGPGGSDTVDVFSKTGRVVFAKWDTVNACYFLFSMDLDGDEVSQLSFSEEVLTDPTGTIQPRGNATNPRWSRDGSRIVYSESIGPDESHIVMMNSDGSGKKILTQVGGYDTSPRWSPVGDRILYVRGGYLGIVLAASIVDTSGFSFDLALDPASRVFDGDTVYYDLSTTQWNPDGSQLYIWGSIGAVPTGFCGERTNAELFLFNIATGRIISRLTDNLIDECRFEVSPVSQDVLLVRGNFQTEVSIYLLVSGANELTKLTSGLYNTYPKWSNDGSLVAFMKDEDDDRYSTDFKAWLLDPKSPGRDKRISMVEVQSLDIHVDISQ